MKKIVLLVIVLMITMGAVAANAAVYTFTPPDKDLGDLDHTKYYKWGINWTHTSETITGATLKIFNIYDWQHEVDSLYIHLLDNPPLGLTTGNDADGSPDHFFGVGKWISTWSDPYGDPSHKANLTYDLGSLGLLPSLQTYASNGLFGFGFDPDCHYYNDSIQVCITTGSTPTVPEPGMLSMLGLGLSGIALYLRRKK
ncbi:MAG: PEP-CTERM sorting domain-containing protein [candidate division Zixibacteria bacterium]|nr:PEP-CTERM sorting domain-containing protein [candidate division Zixibacteria bacterium]